MSHLDTWYDARDHMVDALIADLHGSAEDVELSEEPLERFIVGILYPSSGNAAANMIETANATPEDGSGTEVDAEFDPGISLSHLRYPSTMGVTFGMTESTRELHIAVEAARYEPLDDPDAASGEPDTAAVATRAKKKRISRWRRVATGPVTIRVDVAHGMGAQDVAPGLELRVIQRPPRGGVVIVTAVLINTLERPEKELSDAYCWFQPLMRITTTGGQLTDRRASIARTGTDPDESSSALLYRSERQLAVGHGVGVTWEEIPGADTVTTTFFPRHDVPLAQPDRADVPTLDMRKLANDDDLQVLEQLVARYEEWIAEQDSRIIELPAEHQDAALRHLADAREAAGRMRRGIDAITQNVDAGVAFRAMNEVMRQQRMRQEMIRRRLAEPPLDLPTQWRPFQLAFILMCLDGIVDPDSGDRDIADLLWFPTGGGKTEAYLGLIAFTLIHRRLRGAGSDHNGAGVGVIMRYTLRLLTLQQFERATGLICALENWRTDHSEYSSWEPFSIGLWVGQAATPNNIKDAAAALRKRRSGDEIGDLGDPVQLLRCPWCGKELGIDDYSADKLADRLVVRCPNRPCRFADFDGLPVHVIDSDVYRARPSLVIGTVDKFAMLTWRGESGSLFGQGWDAPPDLIVQDELHLISGPLGTLVGLYETAVDHLATDRASGVRPKLIASTATIRRSADQVRAVFDRDTHQFPPPGLDASDSFFAVDAPADVKGTRRYVGLMAPGSSHATLLVRTYAALLQQAADPTIDDEARDAYWTLLGYFNSLRVLGAAYIQSVDDVRDRIKVVATRRGSPVRQIRDPRELTSRRKSTEIPEELKALESPWGSDTCPDIVLATNMISVGVDVDRLGLMAVMGQPQTAAEYIQATSRVGRRHPGLVLTLFNASRSRDLSHYESFVSYHRSLYRHVEANGATPFAARALDRGLHGMTVALARHLVQGATDDSAVAVPAQSGLDEVFDVIRRRVEHVMPEALEDLEESMDLLESEWRAAAESGEVSRYVDWGRSSQSVKALVRPAGGFGSNRESALTEEFPPSAPPWPTLTSLRNVDRESTLRIVRRRARTRGEK